MLVLFKSIRFVIPHYREFKTAKKYIYQPIPIEGKAKIMFDNYDKLIRPSVLKIRHDNGIDINDESKSDKLFYVIAYKVFSYYR